MNEFYNCVYARIYACDFVYQKETTLPQGESLKHCLPSLGIVIRQQETSPVYGNCLDVGFQVRLTEFR